MNLPTGLHTGLHTGLLAGLLAGKVAVVHGAGGTVGSALATAFAAQGASVHLAGRTLAKVEEVAGRIADAGGIAETAQVDAMDERAVEEHADAVVASAGRIDIAVNAVGPPAVQGVPLVDLSVEEFTGPIRAFTTTVFLTARAAARRMIRAGSGGVILTLSASPARLPGPLMGGFGISCGAIETLTRHLAGELGPHGIRVVCLRPNKLGIEGDLDPEFEASLAAATLLGRLPTLAEAAATAAFLVSDHAGAMTAAVANLTCGAVVD